MRFIMSLPIAMLLGACLSAQHPVAEPGLRVSYGDLDLGTRDGRAELRRRIRLEIEKFCRFHRREVVPQALGMFDTYYCHVAARDTMANELPVMVRRAYRAAFEEGRPGPL